MFMSETLQEKWQPVLSHPDLPEISDPYKKAVTSVVLENQERAFNEERGYISEDSPVNNAGGGVGGTGIDNWNPILISLVRRSLPNLIAYDICGVQPMTGPTGLVFCMKARYNDNTSRLAMSEALFNEADTDFSGAGTQAGTDPFGDAAAYATGTGMTTAAGEAKGDSASNAFASMAFTIEKATVTAKSRALKAEYTIELAQDLKAIHGLDAETELANILSAEILAEINREVVRTVNLQAKAGAQTGVANAGRFDLDVDSSGRWSVEKFKGMLFQIERDANVIARESRRGKGNFILCSSDVASALSMAGMLDYAPALNTELNVDDAGNTFVGVLNGKYKVYIDPYYTLDPVSGHSNEGYMTVGYRGSNPYDAGVFYCPYVPLQMVRAVGQDSFQPKIGFKTRYGMASNPYTTNSISNSMGDAKSNQYYRIFRVYNILKS
jgi:hypothetical protein